MNEKTPKNWTEEQSDFVEVGSEASRATEKTPDRSDYFVSGPEGATFNVSAEVAEEIKEKNGGELPDHIRIREDQVIN